MSDFDPLELKSAEPEQMEIAYQTARRTGRADDFRQAVDALYADAPDSPLFAAWHYRLLHEDERKSGAPVGWAWAVPLALLNGLIFWWLSDDKRFVFRITSPFSGEGSDFIPVIIPLAGPVAALFVLLYLAATGNRRWRALAGVAAALAGVVVYVIFVYPLAGPRPFQEQYLTLMAMHLPLLAWAGAGVFLAGLRRNPANRFAFLIKSFEIFIMAGLFVIAGGLFTGVTFGLFGALNIEPPVLVQRLFIAGGGGLIPVLAVAVLYNPAAPPREQAFDAGLSKLVALLLRLLLPLTLLVMLVYLGFIPFNFREPFENRDVLIIYNGMLFAVMALLVGATPVDRAELSPAVQIWLRRGIVAVAALALLISLYALAAIVYRTAMDRLTPNRLTFIGWNLVNLGLLGWLLIVQARAGKEGWLAGLQRTFSRGAEVYTVWTLLVILALPWLFTLDRGAVESLPPDVQQIVYTRSQPVLLKCTGSPHIYLLDGSRKRWIRDIPTFEERGYRWSDVSFISCADLRTVPDGAPIPADAGPPPQP